MKESTRRLRVKRIAQSGIFTATTISLGYLLFFIPNIELMSASIFSSGWLFGPTVGFIVGGTSFAIFSFFNPLGASLPPLFIAQVIGGILLGVAGGFCRISVSGLPLFLRIPILGIAGGLLTLFYDVITNIGGFIAFTTEKTFLAYLISGIVFSLVHIISNVLIFSMLLAPILGRIEILRKGMTL
ncbi:MAG: hypothetical protein E3J78_00375 [Candidatus Cloacimonadota bacterium]|nr:MAG: hypothetical protein E3J78_00375 [Candidatus Cloacimonadota bacterium]